MEAYDHLIKIDEDKVTLSIYRVLKDGKLQLFTSIDLSKVHYSDPESLGLFAKLLGENLLIDSPVARKLLHL